MSTDGKRPEKNNMLAFRLTELGMSQETFASRIGVHRDTVHRWVNGRQSPKLTPKKNLFVCQLLDWTAEQWANAFPEDEKTPEN
jgi:DNA-binding XRE family transcriptional regulator